MASEAISPPQDGLGATNRRDNWWAGPLATVLGLGCFGIYSTFRVFYNAEYELGHSTSILPESAYLLSPFYSPLFIIPWLPSWVSPALLILWAPGGFRLTCYYYRKAYYRSFFLDPPACSVGEPRNSYQGETKLFLFQNLHRFFLYLALLFIILLAIEVVHSCLWPSGNGLTFGMSVGTLVLAVNVVLLSLYVFSCHSLRHLIGGNIDCFSCVALGPARHKLWKGTSLLNKKHMFWAWTSLFAVGFADFYVWMVASGRLVDVRIF